MNAFMSLTTFWGTTANLLGASTPNESGNGGALALGALAATLVVLGFVVRTLERSVESRREKERNAERELGRREREARAAYWKNNGNVVCTTWDSELYVERNRGCGGRRRVGKKWNAERREWAARLRSARRAALGAVVLSGIFCAASLSTRDASTENERGAASSVAENAKQNERWENAQTVEIREVSSDGVSLWKDSGVFQDAEDEWSETTGETAREKSSGENGTVDENKESGEKGASAEKPSFASIAVGKKSEFVPCRAVDETVAESSENRRGQTPVGRRKFGKFAPNRIWRSLPLLR